MLSFATDVRPLFTDTDVAHMQGFGIDLSSRESVQEHADDILSTVTTGAMPPRSENRTWTKAMCDTFEQWIKDGFPP